MKKLFGIILLIIGLTGVAFAMQAPQEAIDACSGVDVGASCSFEDPLGTVFGYCDANNVCSPDYLPVYESDAMFSDISGHKYEASIEYIAERGIVNGYDDGTYRPDDKINRAELMKIILEANDVDVSDEMSGCFPDVASEWYAKYVCKGEDIGIVNGYDDGYFRPVNNVNFVEALKIIELGYGAVLAESDPWYQTFVDEAESKNMIPNDIDSNDELITRGQMADIIMRQLTYEDGTQDEYVGEEPVVTESAMVDTGQTTCYNESSAISCPSTGENFYGQDGNYTAAQPSYTDNGDGTVTDNVTGLMWQQDPGDKQEYYDAVDSVDGFELAGYSDWRVPTIKELYTLIDFSGEDVDPMASSGSNPFIDDNVFAFEYGDTSTGDRIIDSQWVTSSIYVADVMNGQECFFGVNFADGRIKCYPTASGKGYFSIFVRGDQYGVNNFVDNGDGTVTDESSDLMWQQEDSDEGMIWEDALSYCEDLSLAGYDDWRLPNSKELQYIVDYSRSPDTTGSAAIDPVFDVSEIVNEAGDNDYPFFWTGTTHTSQMGGSSGAYISFGRALGYMSEFGGWVDVHGAGAQRSDPKTGDPDDYPTGHGPQGDAIRIYNYVRCVR